MLSLDALDVDLLAALRDRRGPGCWSSRARCGSTATTTAAQGKVGEDMPRCSAAPGRPGVARGHLANGSGHAGQSSGRYGQVVVARWAVARPAPNGTATPVTTLQTTPAASSAGSRPFHPAKPNEAVVPIV